jgi:hypothetical protein
LLYWYKRTNTDAKGGAARRQRRVAAPVFEKKENSEKKDKKENAVGEKKENASLLLSCPTERAHIYYTWKWLGEETRHSNGGGEGVWREGVGGSPLLSSVSLGGTVCEALSY